MLASVHEAAVSSWASLSSAGGRAGVQPAFLSSLSLPKFWREQGWVTHLLTVPQYDINVVRDFCDETETVVGMLQAAGTSDFRLYAARNYYMILIQGANSFVPLSNVVLSLTCPLRP